MTDPNNPARKLVNRTSDLPISARDKRARYEADGDALGALEWRTEQISGLLGEMARVVQEPMPTPPSWGDVSRASRLLARLAAIAVDLGLYASKGEALRVLGIDGE